MSKPTPEQKVREYNRGRNAARDGRSRYWSEPSAYPFESDEHYQGRTEAFDQGYDDEFWKKLKREVSLMDYPRPVILRNSHLDSTQSRTGGNGSALAQLRPVTQERR
jgi:hypothetical protein